MITQIIRKQFFCVTDVHVIGILILRQLLCDWRIHKNTYESARITQKKCQKALCNRCPVQLRNHYARRNYYILNSQKFPTGNVTGKKEPEFPKINSPGISGR